MNGGEENKTNTTSGLCPGVYLLPVTLSDTEPQAVLPEYNLRVIRGLRHFVVENVRTARRFLKRVDRSIDIDSLELVELSEHTPLTAIDSMLDPVREGYAIGVMSEAGCPAVADPGALLVAAAQRHSIKVFPLVGPSSILLSLMGSGMNGQAFTFHGYLPIEDKKRIAALKELANYVKRTGATQIFIETPYRNNQLLSAILSSVPADVKLCVASDITGQNETIVTRTVGEWKKASVTLDKLPTIFLLGN